MRKESLIRAVSVYEKGYFKGPNILHTLFLTCIGLFRAPVLLLPVSVPFFPILSLLFYLEHAGSRYL
jgi:hypothetical protein